MKGRIFIAWSGDNQLASEVKTLLEEKDYIGIVGGEGRNNNGLFVGDTVLDEINHCNQAIFVVQKKKDGSISNNLMFEFGYSLARFSANKIHVFYIDIAPNDDRIPSDLKGIWADHYMTSDTENIAEKIADKFQYSQKHIIPQDKITVVDSYYSVKSMLQCYVESPQCSEYELAQYILLFSQAAYLFGNEKESLECLKNLSTSLHNPGSEVSLAISYAICTIDFFLDVQKSGDVLYIKKEKFRTLDRRLHSITEAVLGWEQDDFTRWFLVMAYDIMNYAKILYACNPEISKERGEVHLRESLELAEKCIVQCDVLLESPANQHFAELFKAYMYRNLASAQKMLGMDRKSIHENYEKALEMRGMLWDYYSEAKRINTKLLESFEMEYYLASSEVLEFIEDDYTYEDFCEECQEYIDRVKSLNLEKSHFIDRIERNITQKD